MLLFLNSVFWFHVISMKTSYFKLFFCAPSHKMKLKNSSVIFVLCISDQGVLLVIFLSVFGKILLVLLHGIWFAHIAVFSGKESLQGGLLASEFYYKIILYIWSYLETIKYLVFFFLIKQTLHFWKQPLQSSPFTLRFWVGWINKPIWIRDQKFFNLYIYMYICIYK